MKVTKVCQYCGKEYKVPENQKDRSKFCSDKCFRASKNTQVECICAYCGTPFKTQKSKRDKAIKNNKQLFCSKECAKNIQKPKWNDIVALFNERGYILLSTEYVNAKTKLEYLCPEHLDEGVQGITYGNLKAGFGCKFCGFERTTTARRAPFEYVKEVFAKNDMILLEQEYVNANQPLKYICKHHPEMGVQYKCLANAHKQHCPYCHKNKGESAIRTYLVEHDIKFIPQKTYDNLYGVNGGKLSYDFLLPEYNLLIEFQGEQHETPIEFFGGEDQFKIQQEHDYRKREYAKQYKINLLEIWYYDLNNIEKILNEHLK